MIWYGMEGWRGWLEKGILYLGNTRGRKKSCESEMMMMMLEMEGGVSDIYYDGKTWWM